MIHEDPKDLLCQEKKYEISTNEKNDQFLCIVKMIFRYFDLAMSRDKGVYMSDNPKNTVLSPERVERSIIRRIGRTRYAQLCQYLQEDVEVAIIMKEFSLQLFQVYAVRERLEKNPIAKELRIQTN